MSVAKVIEILAESDTSWEAAVQDAVKVASKTVKNIKTVYASEFQALVDGDQVTKFRVNCKITFVIED